MDAGNLLAVNEKKEFAPETAIANATWHIANFDRDVEKLLAEESFLIRMEKSSQQPEINLRFFLKKQCINDNTACDEHLALMAELVSDVPLSVCFNVFIKWGSSSCGGIHIIGHVESTVITPQFFSLGSSAQDDNLQELRKIDPPRPTEMSVEIKVKLVDAKVDDAFFSKLNACFKVTSGDSYIRHMRRMMKTSAFSDVTLITKGGKKIFAHVYVLVGRCPYFAKLLENLNDQTDYNRTVNLEFANEKPLNILLEWMYTAEIEYEDWDIKIVPEILQLAVKLEMHLFIHDIDETLAKLCTTDNVVKLFQLAEQHRMKKAFADIEEFIKKNLGIPEEIDPPEDTPPSDVDEPTFFR